MMSANTDDLRILIIDDDALIRMLAAEALREAGFVVAEADSGEEGLQLFDTLRPDVVLLDVMMPGMDGFEVCGRLRNHPRRGHVPVIMMTGLDDTASIERAYDSGATDFIAKPINWTLLRYRINYVMRAATALDELIRSERNLVAAQQIAAMGSWEWTFEGDLLRRSDSYFGIFGEDALRFGDGMDALLAHVYGPDRETVEAAIAGLRKGLGYKLDYRIIRPDGQLRTVHELAMVVRDLNDEAVAVQGTLQDITERVEAERRIRFLAYFDELSGLPNRACFVEMLRSALMRCTHRGVPCGVVVVNLARFGRVNESLGQDFGDQALQLISARLREFDCGQEFGVRGGLAGDEVARRGVARLGSGRFAILAEGVADVPALEGLAHQLLARIKAPFTIAGQELALAAYAGMALAPHHGDDAESLVKAAETALGEARREGGAERVEIYSEAMKVASYARISMESRLRRAISGGELRLYFQPKVDAISRTLIGAEALVRWEDPERGLVPPGAFIPLAEESGLIAPLSDWVLRTAVSNLAAWRDVGLPQVPLSLNLCAAQFRSARIVNDMVGLLERYSLTGSALEIEVTESVLMKDVEAATLLFHELAALGIRISIDDFGTGYSSLAYLKRFRVNTLKIDRSFVKDLPHLAEDGAIVSAIIAMARNLELGVIAEGVETAEQMRQLLDRGCSHMQGFLFARPLPTDAYAQVLRNGLAPIGSGPQGLAATGTMDAGGF
jgi:diguanylate cyclase (GGDEF)-like protein